MESLAHFMRSGSWAVEHPCGRLSIARLPQAQGGKSKAGKSSLERKASLVGSLPSFQGVLPGHPLACLMRGKPSELLRGELQLFKAFHVQELFHHHKMHRWETQSHFPLSWARYIPKERWTQSFYPQAPSMSATAEVGSVSSKSSRREAFVPAAQPWQSGAGHVRLVDVSRGAGDTVYQ